MSDSLVELERKVESMRREVFWSEITELKQVIADADLSPQYKDILELPSLSEHWLEVGDAPTRLYAMQAIALPWRDKQAYAAASIRHLDDPDEKVAASALYGVAKCYKGTADEAIVSRMVSIIKKTNRSADLRVMCLDCLYDLLGIDGPDRPDVYGEPAENVLASIDWGGEIPRVTCLKAKT